MAYTKSKIAEGGNGQTVWLKHKTVKNRKGEEKDVYQGSVDLGGGKMIKISLDARLYAVELENGDTAVPAYCSKWKSEQTQKRKQNRSW